MAEIGYALKGSARGLEVQAIKKSFISRSGIRLVLKGAMPPLSA